MKYDGYRLLLERDGDRVRLITRGGYDCANLYPWIVDEVDGGDGFVGSAYARGPALLLLRNIFEFLEKDDGGRPVAGRLSLD
ncbi:hypothetical protein [Bradyrhizobium sp. Gha]|uniref:hypothetical protein n=1 Tax=Bradyrhizobium sp. Gha TaxID=1855318 RepID=UPI001FCD8EBD|nr:hypothetical protein [Bradyrhizobium sp. Gha]